MASFNSIWINICADFDMNGCTYQNINGRIFIHLPKTQDSKPVRIKITRSALLDTETLSKDLYNVIVEWLGNCSSSNTINVQHRLGPNQTYYYVIDNIQTVYSRDYYNEVITSDDNQDDIEWDDGEENDDEDLDRKWDDSDDPSSYLIDENGIKYMMWTENWASTFVDDY